MTPEWKNALASRIAKQTLDSLFSVIKPVSTREKEWITLIESKTGKWLNYADSLKIPFKNCRGPRTIYLYIGNSGQDDGFTFGYNTVCFDLSALLYNYGVATRSENAGRIDRLFAHELTHLIHKEWAQMNTIQLKSYKDSVLWECMYEGIGMYRSLSNKWLPQNGVLPEITRKTLEELVPVFVDRLIEVETSQLLDETTKSRIVANLSRGQVDKKWGAFTIAIWLAMEANGDDNNLQYWIGEGLNSPILLAKKHLTGHNREKFEKVFK